MIQHIKGCHLKNTRKNTVKQKKNVTFVVLSLLRNLVAIGIGKIFMVMNQQLH